MSRLGEADEKCNVVLRRLLVKFIRESNGDASYRHLSVLTGLSDAYLHQIDKGLRRGFSFATAMKVLRFLNISLAEFERIMKEYHQ